MQFEDQVKILEQGKQMTVDQMEKFLKQKVAFYERNLEHSKQLFNSESNPAFVRARAQYQAVHFIMGSFLKEFKGQSIADYKY